MYASNMCGHVLGVSCVGMARYEVRVFEACVKCALGMRVRVAGMCAT